MADDSSEFTESFGASNQDATKQAFSDINSEQPEKVGRYSIEKFLGRGGFGAVYLGYDPQLERSVAIKVPHAKLVASPAIAETYLEEARNVAKLDHPNIVPVFDVGSTEEFPCFIVSKYIEGTDLSCRQKESPLSLRESVELVAKVGSALHYAHKQGLFHRDVKPNNLMVDSTNQPYLVDFGLALREENVGKGPAFVGTLAFMSPEQARGEGHRVDGRSDVFSLGVVLYFLLVGRRPFKADSKAELLEQISSYEARPLRQYNDQIPKELERICLKAMSKKATDRYSTAKDFADDLSLFLEDLDDSSADIRTHGVADNRSTMVPTKSSGTVDDKAHSDTAEKTSSFESDSDPVRIIPKGLRSFDSEDHEFFLELIPGARDRTGVPDVIRFWKSRIEETDPVQTFSVGLIYGPSGCGKSSLVKAGLLPRVDDHVLPVYIEASPDETETRLLNRLRKHCPNLDETLDLKETLGALRKGQGIPPGKKVLIVIDQFEQWLHVTREEAGVELAHELLTHSLRQCDGGRLQCILMVRDDFWMAVTRLLQELEVELIQGHNFATVDLFPIRHAEKVLAAFGRAYGALPEDLAASPGGKQFVKQAVSGLAVNGTVISVRLALFAEMMKNRPWTLQSLRELGGTEGVGFSFLEETFSSKANPKFRLHEKAARAVLNALLPDTGTDIKGEMKSRDELLKISGYENRTNDFAALMTILDREIRLVTPTDPSGSDDESESSQKKYYQLTHDYLVRSLRDWLSRKEKETRKGRARLRLQDLSSTWNSRPENRYLPSAWDYLRIRSLTESSKWTEPQAKMMKRAGRVHGFRSVCGALALLLIVWTGLQIQNGFRLRSNEKRAGNLVEFLVAADIEQVDSIVNDLDADELREFADPLLERKFADAQLDESSRLKVALALLPNHPDKSKFLVKRIPFLSIAEFRTVCDSISKVNSIDEEPLWKSANDSSLSSHSRFLASVALARLSSDTERWSQLAPIVATHLTAGVPASDLLTWTTQLEGKRDLLAKAIADIILDRDPLKSKRRERACLVLGELLPDDPLTIVDSLLVADERYEHLPLYQSLKPKADQVISKLTGTLNSEPVRSEVGDREETLRSKGIAAATLIKFGHGQEVWPLLKHSPDPSLRSFIIKSCRQLQVDHDFLLKQSEKENDVSARRALILAAGHFQETEPPDSEWINHLLGVYKSDPDSGVHAAAGFTLRQWKVELPKISAGLSRIPQDQIKVIRKFDDDVEYARTQLELSTEQLPRIRVQWEKQFRNVDEQTVKTLDELRKSLVAHFTLDEENGVAFNNQANADEPGRFFGDGTPERLPGIGGNAIRFDGHTQSIVSGKSFNPDLKDSFTMGCWIHFKQVDQARIGSILSKMGTSEMAFRGFDLWFESGRVGAHFKNEYPINMIKTLTTSPISSDRWHQVWVVYDGSGEVSRVSVFVDGRLASSDLINDSLTKSFSTDMPLRIGSRSDPQTVEDAYPFAGMIDDVRIYNRSLSAEEIRVLFQQGLRKVISVGEAERTQPQKDLMADAHLTESQPIQKMEAKLAEKIDAASKARWHGRQHWFVNEQNQTMVVIPKSMIDGKISIPYDFAIGAFEVTAEQFKQYNPTPGFLDRIVPTDDCPAHQLNWYDAAGYCNWLTIQDGIHPSQTCYLPNDNGEWGPGVKIKTDFKTLRGYRLPTEEEWEFAAKAFSRRQYYFGDSPELLNSYGWYASNSKARSYPVGSLLPNDFGLFDMQGNVWEWIIDMRGDLENQKIDGVRRILGGGLDHLPSTQRSENSFIWSAENRNRNFGFRVVRMVPDSVK